jgi:DNA polymerase-1
VTDRPTVAILDADLFCYRIGFSSEDDEEQFALSRLTEWVTDVVFFDLKCQDYRAYISGKNNFRYDIAKTQPYKGNRKDLKRPKHLEALRAHMQRLGAKVTEGQEADDAVAIESMQGNYWLVHQDKDLNQLAGWHYNPVTCVEYFVTPEEGLKSFYMQVLTGDNVDHIPGLFRVGPKKAEKILDGCQTEEEMCRAAFEAYVSKGHGKDYFLEQGRLLWLCRHEGDRWTPPVDF